MKKLLTIFVFFLYLTSNLQAQQGTAHGFKNNEKIKALKTGFITDALELTSKEAEKFWPVYNVYDSKIMDLRFKKARELRKKVEDLNNADVISEKDAKNLLNEFLEVDKAIINAKTDLNKQLLEIMSAKKILKLYKAEDDFNRHLLQRLQDPKRNPNNRPGGE